MGSYQIRHFFRQSGVVKCSNWLGKPYVNLRFQAIYLISLILYSYILLLLLLISIVNNNMSFYTSIPLEIDSITSQLSVINS